MARRLNWLEILNVQAEWTAPADTYAWLGKIAGRECHPGREVVERFNATLDFIREQLTHMHFGEPLETASLNRRLSTVRLELGGDAAVVAAPRPAVRLKALRARADDESDDGLLTQIENTVLLEFASTVGAYMDDPVHSPVERCEGIYKEPGASQLSPAASFDSKLELRWRQEIPVLAEHGLTTTQEIQRCIDFFPTRPKARFCSPECRFRTFQLTKQLNEPDYLAAKQRRYRSRQED